LFTHALEYVLNRVTIGGWDRDSHEISPDIDEEVDKAFENVDHCLKHAGGQGWPQVFQVRLYMTDITEAAMAALVRNLKHWLPDHQPILTGVGVSALAIPGMHVEIEVTAHDPKETENL
jgi:enamine deaminase RidA (YjgF/YER057c/UK114 family)